MTEKLKKSDEQWREQLSPEEYSVARQAGTERAFSGRYWDCKDDGTYCCLCCGQELFKSDAKFDSGTGWPSFDRAVNAGAVEVREDMSMGMMRTEVVCSGCDAHLGHVFPDGPPTTGERYCMNSASLKLRPEDKS
jgi:peptide-methionine (R)-S-oxide reductase